MSPDPKARRQAKKKQPASRTVRVKRRPSPDDVHDIAYFKRPAGGDTDESVPGRDFLNSVCPAGVRAKMRAVLIAVAEAPPKRFAGGGYWEAMKGEMTGWFEVRADGPDRRHYRLYCRLDYDAKDREKPLLVVITGLDKPFRTTLTEADYAAVRVLGNEYFAINPRSIA